MLKSLATIVVTPRKWPGPRRPGSPSRTPVRFPVTSTAVAAPAARAADKLKVGCVYVGPVGDFGYSYQHDQGRQFLQKELGDKVETTFLENVPENDSERAFEQLARSGHKLIFGTSFGFMDPMLKVAKRFPKVTFEHATGYKQALNLAT